MKFTIKKNLNNSFEGLLPVNKSTGFTSFYLVKILRKITKIKKIGHAGTLDPFASGVMLLLIGKNYTKKANELIGLNKQYLATIKLGIATDTYDLDGKIEKNSDYIPSFNEVEKVINFFQNEITQTPPMYSAKKINGKKLYELARQNITIERPSQLVLVKTKLISYEYPFIKIQVKCSKGTYIRSIAHDMGIMLNTYGHLVSLTREKIGAFTLKDCIDQKDLSFEHIEKFLLI
jgi:tRNA pseudouridine55 synthase